MTKLSQATAVAIATAASQVRQDWDHGGILHALRIEADKGTHAEDVFAALAEICRRPDVRTPAFLNQPGSHWKRLSGEGIPRRGDNDVRCDLHPDHVMPCTHRDHLGDMTPEQIAEAAAECRRVAAQAQADAQTRRAEIENRRQEATR